MKTLVVLSTLVGLAISAPAPQDSFQDGPRRFLPNGLQKLEPSGGMQPLDFNTEINAPAHSARSHRGPSNPVIVKKKDGFYVYPDSTEERAAAEPHENCGKQVRVKFCDGVPAKSAEMRRSTNDDFFIASKDDVHDSIKLAKEAVESLQRDLKTIEPSGKSGPWKQGRSDMALHEDIEAARVALEQAQMKQIPFGDLESMNLHATTLRDSEALPSTGKNNIAEDKMAQWKAAMEAIHRNVEIARNIEDSIRADEHRSSLTHSDVIDTTNFMRSSNQENLNKIEGTKQTQEFDAHKVVGKATELIEEDMKPAASELVQTIHENPNSETKAKLAKDDVSLRSANKDDKHDYLDMETHFDLHRSLVNKERKSTQGAKKQRESLSSDIDLKQEENAWTEIGDKETMLKAAEPTLVLSDKVTQVEDKHQASPGELDAELSMKSAENSKDHNQNKNDLEQNIKKSEMPLHNEMKSADNVELASDIHLSAPSNVLLNHDIYPKNPKFGKTADLPKDSVLETEARFVKHMKHGHFDDDQHGYGHHEHGHLVHGHLGHGHLEHGHGYIDHGYGHHNVYGHHGHGHFGKAAEFDMEMHPSKHIKDFVGKSAMENINRLKHHNKPRSSYGLGSYGAGGGSAVGVFPHARVGGCGIPLLLSCSPSVVSGSLAKPHRYEGYDASGPAYRDPEESKSVNKRDIIKTKETSLKNIKYAIKPAVTEILEKAF